MSLINTTNIKPNILEQLAAYNSNDLDNYSSNLNVVLSEQSQLNEVLKNKKHDENIVEVQNFISRNGNQIEYQLEQIKTITEKIHAICLENENLENEEEEYKQLINSPECVNIAHKLSEIKKTKEDIRAFLLKKGIHLPK